MNPLLSSPGFAALYIMLSGLSTLASLAVLAGIVLLILWAHRTLKDAALKKWGLILAIGGVVVAFLSILVTPMMQSWAMNRLSAQPSAQQGQPIRVEDIQPPSAQGAQPSQR